MTVTVNSSTTIADLIRARSTALAYALEVIAEASDVSYLADALTADSVSDGPHLMENTIAVVSADGEASIRAIIGRFGSGTVNELRVALGIPATAAIHHAVSVWRDVVSRTRDEVVSRLRTLGIPAGHIEKFLEFDNKRLFLTPGQLVETLEALEVFAHRTETIRGESYVLIG